MAKTDSIYPFPAMPSKALSDGTRAALRDLTTAGPAKPGDFLGFMAEPPSRTLQGPPGTVQVIIAGQDDTFRLSSFHDIKPELKPRIALAYACLVSDPEFSNLGAIGLSLNERHRYFFFTPNGMFGLASENRARSTLLFDRRVDPVVEGERLYSSNVIVALVPEDASSNHQGLKMAEEVSSLVSRIAANFYDNAKRQNQSWKHKRPRLQVKL